MSESSLKSSTFKARKAGYFITAIGIALHMAASFAAAMYIESSTGALVARMSGSSLILMGLGLCYAAYDLYRIKFPRLTPILVIGLTILFVLSLVIVFFDVNS